LAKAKQINSSASAEQVRIHTVWQVERVREFSREHAKWALIWQRFYETRPDPNVRVLQKSDKDVLKNVLKPERLDATRRIYVCIVEHIRPSTSNVLPAFASIFCSANLAIGA